jgi:hypothetical protein
MYSYLLTFHSLFRWLVLISLLCSIGIGWTGLTTRRHFSAIANAFRHWTATIAHIQLVLGMTLYFQSPIVRYPVPRDPDHIVDQQTFFRYIHSAGMFLAIIVITIGSAKAKRMTTDGDKYRIMVGWFIAALVIILCAIPWPFSPLASRPYERTF